MEIISKTPKAIIFKVKNTRNEKVKCCIFDLTKIINCPNVNNCYCHKTVKVTIKDIIKYKAVDCKQMELEAAKLRVHKSGDFYLSGFLGNWEMIDTIVEKALEYFRQVAAKTLQEEGLKVGLML
jgi:hypothetical protein